MFIMSHLVGPLIAGPAAFSLYFFDPTPGFDLAVLGLGIAAFWLFPFFLRYGASLSVLIVLSLALVHFILFWSCFHYGGVGSPTMIWILIVPILGACYLGGEKSLQPYLVALSASSVAIFVAAYALFNPGPNDVPPGALLGLGWVSTLAVLFYVAFMAVYYSRIFDAGVELEAEVRHRRRMARELQGAVAAADRATAVKTEFLARMSHELRNPLHSILGYGQLLREEALDKGDERFLRDVTRIVTAGTYLMRLVNMVLNLAKLEAGRTTFDIQLHCVETIVMNLIEKYREDIERGDNRVEVLLQPQLGKAELDAGRLGEVIGCLLTNAAQHTRNGVITVAGSRDDGESGGLTIAVSDTGVGMSPDLLSSLFRIFPIKKVDSGQLEGTGLHLAIVGRLCAAMGGRITARSVLGRGSTFTVTLPVNRTPPESPVA